jgi:hypothetical protein
MMHSPLFSTFLMAVLLHLVGLATVSHVWRGLGVSLPFPSQPIIVSIAPVELPPEPVLLPESEPNTPPALAPPPPPQPVE